MGCSKHFIRTHLKVAQMSPKLRTQRIYEIIALQLSPKLYGKVTLIFQVLKKCQS